MKKLCFVLLMSCCVSWAYGQDSWRLKLLGHWNDTTIQPNPDMPGQSWNELTGYVDSVTHREYAIVGSIDSVYFFDVTDPAHIRVCDVEWGLNRAINRDIETYRHYAYCVSDNSTPGKLQIYDLSYLPDSVHKIYESDTLGRNTHSIFINKPGKRLYMCINKHNGNIVNGMEVYSLERPDSPAYLGKLNETLFGNPSCKHVHEVYVRNDTAYCSCEYNGLYVIDFTDVANQKPLGSITPPYPYNGYNHTNWVDSSGQYIAFTDEVPHGMPAKIYQIRDLSDMTYLTHFNTHEGATPHNVFWVGNKIYFSWYHDGVYIFSVDTPRKPRLYAFYDTYPQNEAGVYDNYKGCWGVYPFLPSGNIIASDMTNGLFVLRYDVLAGLAPDEDPVRSVRVYPNPAADDLWLTLFACKAAIATIKVCDVSGQVLLTQSAELESGEQKIHTQNFNSLSRGIYFVRIESPTGIHVRKVIKE